jgi:hypothetical protein
MSIQLSQEQLNQYRAGTFRTLPGQRLTSPDQAVDFVNERGFVFFWPIKNVIMPSLWAAVAGDRPVPDEHDDPGHITWNWKDSLLGKRRWYYARILRKRNTMISLNLLPCFYALSPNYGDYAEDYLIDYESGQLPLPAKVIYETILREGPLDTIALRKLAGFTNQGSDSEFNSALDLLQTTFRILPIGVAEAGAWRYAFIYEIVARHYPDLSERAHPISEPEARQALIATYLASVGAVPVKEIHRIFGYTPLNWPTAIIERDLGKMAERGEVHLDVQIDDAKAIHIATASLIQG